MANETTTQTPATQADPKSTASNIVNAIQNKANGKASAPPQGVQKPPETPPDPNAGKEKYVANGKEVWLTPEQRTAYVQKGIAFEPKVDQLNLLQRETTAFLKTLAEDPLKILTDKRIGLSPEDVLKKVLSSNNISDQIKESVGKWYYDNVVEPMRLSPEELKARERDKKLTEYESREAAARDMMIIEENKRRAETAGKQLLGFVREAMQDSGLPDINSKLGHVYAKRVLELSKSAAYAGNPITPKQAIETTKEEMKEFAMLWLDHLDGGGIVQEIGDENTKKIKKFLFELAKSAETPIPKNQKTYSPRNGERKTISPDDFHDYLLELKKKG